MVRDAAALQRAMSITRELPAARARTGRPRRFSPEMSRRARGFAVWAVLKALGREGVAEMVERHCAVARRIAGRLAAEPGLTVLNEVVLNQVVLACGEGAAGDRLTRATLAAVQADGVCYPSARALAGARDHPGLGLGGTDDAGGRRAQRRGDRRGLAAGARGGMSGAAVIEARGLGLRSRRRTGRCMR